MAYDKNGKAARGRVYASEAAIARDLLTCAGYRSIEVKALVKKGVGSLLQRGLFRVKPAEIVLFFRQLALLLESGVDIVTSLQLLESQCSNRILAKVLNEVVSELGTGNPLSTCLRSHPEVFPPVYCRTMQVGEQTGNLEVVLRQMADYMEKEINAAKGVKSALMYPIITAIVAIIASVVMITFVLPAFTKLYESFGAELPLATRMLIYVSDILQSYGIFLLMFLFAGGGLFYLYSKTEEGKYRLDKTLLSLPLLGRLNHLKELARCGRSISLLFRAGLPMTEIMSQLISGSNNKVVAKALTNVRQDMVRGEGLSGPMAKYALFFPMFVQMVRVGEETGTLDTTLMAVAQSYETEVDDRVKALIGLIQPTMTVLVGIGVGIITLAMVSAMYSIYGQGVLK